MGCDIIRRRHSLSYLNFNPRTHVGCDIFDTSKTSGKIDFNPRTHVGCDEKIHDLIMAYGISIHAPTWGATE